MTRKIKLEMILVENTEVTTKIKFSITFIVKVTSF